MNEIAFYIGYVQIIFKWKMIFTNVCNNFGHANLKLVLFCFSSNF